MNSVILVVVNSFESPKAFWLPQYFPFVASGNVKFDIVLLKVVTLSLSWAPIIQCSCFATILFFINSIFVVQNKASLSLWRTILGILFVFVLCLADNIPVTGACDFRGLAMLKWAGISSIIPFIASFTNIRAGSGLRTKVILLDVFLISNVSFNLNFLWRFFHPRCSIGLLGRSWVKLFQYSITTIRGRVITGALAYDFSLHADWIVAKVILTIKFRSVFFLLYSLHFIGKFWISKIIAIHRA